MGTIRRCAIVFLSLLLLVPIGIGAQVDLLSEGERNDSQESARVLKSGASVQGTIVEGDEDWFSFVANQGDSIRIGVANGFHYNYFLFDSDRTPIDGGMSGDYITFEAPVSGSFFFRMVHTPSVESDPERGTRYTGEYVLHLDIREAVEPTDENELNNERSDATHVPAGGRVHGVLEREDVEWFTFGATRGETLRMISLHGPYEAWWSLFDEDGNRVELQFDGDFVTATAPATGQYFLRYRYNQDWIDGRDIPSSGSFGEYTILFDFDIRTVGSVRTDAETDDSIETPAENGPIDTPRDGSPIEGIDLGVIIAAVIGALATIIAALLSRR